MHQCIMGHGGRLSAIIIHTVAYPLQDPISYGLWKCLINRIKMITYHHVYVYRAVSRTHLISPVAGSGGARTPHQHSHTKLQSFKRDFSGSATASDGRHNTYPAAVEASDEAALATLERSGIILGI